ncbi:hypothetical protein HDE_12211 [Halotydeus destructor]|nr:hypothetical protein HDE_12211 [Halotydeus destructor]
MEPGLESFFEEQVSEALCQSNMAEQERTDSVSEDVIEEVIEADVQEEVLKFQQEFLNGQENFQAESVSASSGHITSLTIRDGRIENCKVIKTEPIVDVKVEQMEIQRKSIEVLLEENTRKSFELEEKLKEMFKELEAKDQQLKSVSEECHKLKKVDTYWKSWFDNGKTIVKYRKSLDEPNDLVEENAVDESAVELVLLKDPSPPKKRGRRARVQEPAGLDDEVQESQPKKRGRKPRAVVTDENGVEQKVDPPKRGRPRKTAKPQPEEVHYVILPKV